MDGKFRFSEEESAALVTARIENDGLFSGKFFDNRAAWEKIQNDAGLQHIDIKKIKKKWIYIMRKYKDMINPPTGKGTEDGEDNPSNWILFEPIHEYASKKHIINPPLIINSEVYVHTSEIQTSHDVSTFEMLNLEVIATSTPPASTSASTSTKKRAHLSSGSDTQPKRSKSEMQLEIMEEIRTDNAKMSKKMDKMLGAMSKLIKDEFGININSDDSDSN